VPPEYPAVPPKCKPVTTGRGRVRFNANLYQNGKVCLSLLGTWDGPGWDPKQSNLLQVVESLAFNIMIGEPVSGHLWFNEPGYSEADCPDGTDASLSPLGKACSKEYNRQVRRCTMQHAMIDMLQTPPKAFVDVIKAHYCAASPMVRQLVDKWALEEGCTSGEAAKLRALATNAKHSLCSLQSVLLLAWHALCKHASSLASALAPPDIAENRQAAATTLSISENAALPLNVVDSLKTIDNFMIGKPSVATTAFSVSNKTDLVGHTVTFVNLDVKSELNGQQGKCLQWLPACGRYVVELLFVPSASVSSTIPSQSSTRNSNARSNSESSSSSSNSGDSDGSNGGPSQFQRILPENLQLVIAAATKPADEEQHKVHTSIERLTAAAASGSSSDTTSTNFAFRRQTCHNIFSVYLQIANQWNRDGGDQGCGLKNSHSIITSISGTTFQSWPTQSEQWSSGAMNAAAETAAMCSVVKELEEQVSALEVHEAKTNEAQAKVFGDKLATLQQALDAASHSENQDNDSTGRNKNNNNTTNKTSASKRSSDGISKSDAAATILATAASNNVENDDDGAIFVRMSELMELLEAAGIVDCLRDEQLLRALVLHHLFGQASYDEILMLMLDENFNPDEWRRKVVPLLLPPAAAAASNQTHGNSKDIDDTGDLVKSEIVTNSTVKKRVCSCTHANFCALGKRCTVCVTDRCPTFPVRKRLATASEALQVEETKMEAASASAAELLRLLKLRDEDPGAVVWEYARNTPHHYNTNGDSECWLSLGTASCASLEKAWLQESFNAARSAESERACLQSLIAASGTTPSTATTSATTAATTAAYASAAAIFKDAQFAARVPGATITVFI